MRIDFRDEFRRRIGHANVDPSQRPSRTRAEGPGESGREVFLNWDSALDDAGKLRRCIVCGCTDLYRSKAFPQITGIVVFLAFIGAVIGVLGLATTPILVAMTVVLVLDVALLVLARKRLVCYRCQTSYRRLPIARYHRWWDRAVAERYPAPEESGAQPEKTRRGWRARRGGSTSRAPAAERTVA